MKIGFFRLAKKAATFGQHKQHRIGAVLIKKNRVIATGFNKSKTHPRSPNFYKVLHAETDCILGVDEEILENSEIYVYRQTRNSTLGTAKPCSYCEWLLRLKKVKKVHYTTEEGYKTYVL